MDMLRKNPEICRGVDVRENMGNWRNVISWGAIDRRSSSTNLNGFLNTVFSLNDLGHFRASSAVLYLLDQL